MSTTNTRPSRETTPHFEHHQCIEVACTECGEPLGEDTIVHFSSMSTALAEIQRCEWHVTDDAVRCYDCIQANDGDPDAQILVVSKCTYCWPPLFAEVALPQSCQCATATTITHRLRVPVISCTHPAFTMHACVTLACPGCGQSVSGNEEYDPHFSSQESALKRASDDYDWLVSDVLVCCGRCAKSKACAAVGHQFPEAPNHTLRDGIEIRCCVNCDATVRNPSGERDQPWL